MDAVLLLVIVTFGLICLALGVVRLLLKNSGAILSIFLGCAAALCLGYFIVALFFIKSVAVVAQPEVETIAPHHALDVPESKPIIDLSEELAKDKDRPAWVESEPVLEGDVYKVSVASDPKLTPLEAEQDLADKTFAATEEYIANLLDKGAITQVKIGRDFIASHIQKEEYFEQVDLPVSKMVIAHGLLVFDKNLRDEFRARYQATKIRWRMIQAGGLAGLVLMLVGTLYGYLKLDTATRGYYSGRLQLTAGALILAVAWAGYRLVEMPR